MAEGKWIDGLSPEMRPEKAARLVLETRLASVLHWLPKASREAEHDPEYVHQLRVSTRRTDAALKLFRDCLPKWAYRQAREQLRSLRRAAGAARDADVLLIELHDRVKRSASKEIPRLDYLIGYAMGLRAGATPGLEVLPVDSFREITLPLLDEIRAPSETCLIDLARAALVRLTERFDQALAGKLSDYAHLHQVRIAGKRLRYGLEVFAGCFPAKLRDEVYPYIENMQEHLGRINDSRVNVERLLMIRRNLKSWGTAGERAKPGIETMLRSHQRRLPGERKRFMELLKVWETVNLKQVLK